MFPISFLTSGTRKRIAGTVTVTIREEEIGISLRHRIVLQLCGQQNAKWTRGQESRRRSGHPLARHSSVSAPENRVQPSAQHLHGSEVGNKRNHSAELPHRGVERVVHNEITPEDEIASGRLIRRYLKNHDKSRLLRTKTR